MEMAFTGSWGWFVIGLQSNRGAFDHEEVA